MIHSLCALTIVARHLLIVAQAQLSRHLAGDFEESAEACALIRLYALIRASICEQTRVLDRSETPDLAPLLSALPPTWREELERAVAAEEAGCCTHEPMLPIRTKAEVFAYQAERGARLQPQLN